MKTLRCTKAFLTVILSVGCLFLNVIESEVTAQNGFVNPNIDLAVIKTVLQPDGKILIGGNFNNVGGQPRSKTARLNSDGTLDSTFQNPNIDGNPGNVRVFALERQNDGKILIGGLFTSVGGQTRNYLARLNSDGTLDANFAPDVNNPITSIAVQTDGRILIGGYFTAVNGQTRNRLARINADGTLDTNFQDPNISQNPNINTAVNTIAVQANGKILIGGYFNLVGGQTRSYAARINADGTLDTNFNLSVSGPVEAFVIQTDGKILVGGFFRTVNGANRTSVARINSDGSLDESFQNPNIPSGNVSALALQPNGKVMVGGDFSNIAGRERDDLARLNADGSFDPTFQDPNANFGGTFYSIFSIIVQPDGKIIVGGDFVTIGRQPRKMVVRLLGDGTLDAPSQNLTVTKTSDTDDGVCDADCSLREAVTAANTNAEASQISFDAQLFSVPQTITLTSGELVAAANRRITISGTGANNLIISGNNSSRILRISRDANVSLSGLTLNNGNGVGGGFSGGEGGAILIEPNGAATQLNLTNTIISNNRATVGGAIRALGVSLVNIINSSIIQNTADYSPGGGGIYFDNGALNITNSIVSGNSQTFQSGSGGGIAIGNTNAVFNLTDSLVSSNFAVNTGGISAAGTTTISNSTISGNQANTSAGGIYAVGNISLNGSTVSGNTVINADGQGGGIFNFGRLNVDNSTISSNSAAFGGGIFTSGGLTATNIKVINNTSSKSGAGIYNNSGGTSALPVNVNLSLIKGNNASEAGGGIYNRDAFNLSFTTVENNSAVFGGGGIFNVFLNVGAASVTASNSTVSSNRSNSAGGISNQQGTVNLTNSTVSSNISVGLGSGINNNLDGTINLNHATIAFNSALSGTGRGINSGSGIVNAQNSIIARNVSGNPAAAADFGGALNSQGYNLIGSTAGTNIGGTTTGNILNVEPRLAPLADNGGATRTHALFLNSPAIDAGTAGGTVTDQRGKQRPFDIPNVANVADGSDIGASERQPDDVTRSAAFDFDGDGKSDISVFRPANASWYLNRSQSGFTGIAFGNPTDVPVPADFDGDGTTDIAVFRNGEWYCLKSANGTFSVVQWGQAGDVPLPADFDGDGRADFNVFRPSNGAWYRRNSSDGSFVGLAFGQNGDKPLQADFDGDGKSDIAVFRPSNGAFYSLNSSDGNFRGIAFGFGTDIPTIGDFDGDGKTDVAVFRPSDGGWYRLNSSNGTFSGLIFGQNGDVPAAADYDGDGKTDVAVFRPSNGAWYYLKSSDNTFVGLIFGFGTDKPIPAAFQ